MQKFGKALLLLHSVFFSHFFSTYAQQKLVIKSLETPPIASIRGMSVVNDSVVWVSGTGGQVGLTTDGGAHWKWMKVPEHDSADWRSLYAFSAWRALLLNAGSPAHLMMTADGGQTWQLKYEDTTKGIFFDDIDFLDNQQGFAIGDPIAPDSKMAYLITGDGGNTWMKRHFYVLAEAGEALFAASGTNMVNHYYGNSIVSGMVTGGKVSRFIGNFYNIVVLPITQGSPSKGAFSLALERDGKKGVIVGGDYLHEKDTTRNCVYTTDSGKSWKVSVAAPGGYRSCVVYVKNDVFITTGPSGTDISYDAGVHWEKISDEGFHVAGVSPNRQKIWLAGSRKLGIIELP
ncbi:YCF48-related protein [Chitinophaga sancti]|uniref:YCF48-related protein n=1 Tax=Chitinophaga sancti TaxID=1004 RepID=UPI003F799FA3